MSVPAQRLRARWSVVVRRRLAPEHTRRATWLERMTVGRLSWRALLRLNLFLEVTGKVATGLWAGIIVSAVVGIDWLDLLQKALNAGKPISSVVALAILAAILLLMAIRSVVGFARWRVQRELWRRELASSARKGE